MLKNRQGKDSEFTLIRGTNRPIKWANVLVNDYLNLLALILFEIRVLSSVQYKFGEFILYSLYHN